MNIDASAAEKLTHACLKIAWSQLNNPAASEPTDLHAVAPVVQLADRFRAAALQAVECSIVEDIDIVVDAILYLEHTHAIPPRGDDVTWFSHMLDCLLELACPNTGQNSTTAPFFAALDDGIADARASIERASR